MPERRADLPPWLSAKIGEEQPDGCWPWIAAKSDTRRLKDYGATWVPRSVPGGGRSMRAHRAMWLALNGPIPEGAFVLHSCDVPSCVNPAHLFLGSQDDNMKDAARKGRLLPTRARGPRHGLARLSWDAVRVIRQSGSTLLDLAIRFNVSKSTVSRARRGITYGRAQN